MAQMQDFLTVPPRSVLTLDMGAASLWHPFLILPLYCRSAAATP